MANRSNYLLGFAPTLGWKGIEDIRFAPGMFQADAEDFFSYALVFLLEEGADVSPEGIQREVLTYYQGLSTAVLKGKGVTVDTSKFELSLAEPKTTDGRHNHQCGVRLDRAVRYPKAAEIESGDPRSEARSAASALLHRIASTGRSRDLEGAKGDPGRLPD